ncbi:Plasmodium exported protein, unknown function [Plasmodium relictum]|uniref:Uncharacterized protein n=1 Tax=Plasmodium relictum TaxID=85471 RepID=A0A1J1GK25_PLARL|nr:Plasmodium exported protein, unknown function [Plasmodium relictum]CRG84427.1 Plasmodium exported protein, unknown function [Plasmodium relictum]
MRSYNISHSIPGTTLISRNIILNKRMDDLFRDSNNISKNRNCTYSILCRFIIVSIIFFLYIYPQYSYESQENVTMGLHFSEYHSRILIQQQIGNIKAVNRHNKRNFEQLMYKYAGESKIIIVGMIFGMKSELMHCPSLEEYPSSLKQPLWLMWSDYLNLRISYLEVQESHKFDELKRSENSYHLFLDIYGSLIREWINLRLELSKTFFFFLRYVYVLLKYAYIYENKTGDTINIKNLLFDGTLGIPGAKMITGDKSIVLSIKDLSNLKYNDMVRLNDSKIAEALNDLIESISIKDKSRNWTLLFREKNK